MSSCWRITTNTLTSSHPFAEQNNIAPEHHPAKLFIADFNQNLTKIILSISKYKAPLNFAE